MMKMVNWTKLLPYLIVSIGLYQITAGLIFINFHYGYTSPVLKNISGYGNVVSFFIIVYGIFLLFLFRGLKKKTWTSWYMAITFIFLYFFTYSLKISKFLPMDIIGIVISALALVILLKYRKKYVFPPITKIPRESLASLGVIVFTMLYGIIGTLILGTQFNPPIKNVNDAIYYTVEVMTTLGFGDILPVTDLSRLFTSSLVILGVASFFGAVATFFGPVIQKRVENVVNIMETAEFSGMKDHIIFCGYNPMISSLIREMKKKEIPFILIVRDQDNATFLRNDGYIVLRERADNPEALKKAGIKRAKKVYISSSDDGYNLMVALTLNKLKKELGLSLKISIFLNSSANMETVKDFVDEIIDISDMIRERVMRNI